MDYFNDQAAHLPEVIRDTITFPSNFAFNKKVRINRMSQKIKSPQ